jgi:hypothetical protein
MRAGEPPFQGKNLTATSSPEKFAGSNGNLASATVGSKSGDFDLIDARRNGGLTWKMVRHGFLISR